LYLYTKLHLGYEFLHFVAPSNVKLSIQYDHTLGISKPIDYYYEFDAEIMNDMKPSLKLEIGDMQVTAGPRFRTYSYYNASAPVDGTNGSPWLTDGSAVDISSVSKQKGSEGGVAFSVPSHLPNGWRIGPLINFSFKKGMAEFGGTYCGFWWHFGGNPDWQGTNGQDSWRNDFTVYATLHI
jgi:hypothetical protein